MMAKSKQHAMHCPCGRAKILAHGICAVCYTLKRQDEEYFGGLREYVLERDGHRCRVCDASGRDKRSIIVHHRVPGKSLLPLMISLARLATQRFIEQEQPFDSCRPSCSSSGESSTPMGMSKGRSASMRSRLPARFCSPFPLESSLSTAAERCGNAGQPHYKKAQR